MTDKIHDNVADNNRGKYNSSIMFLVVISVKLIYYYYIII